MPPKKDAKKGGKNDPARDHLHKRLNTLQNVADPGGLKEAVRVLDLCNTDPLMLKIMEGRVGGWESDVFEALPEDEKDKYADEQRRKLRDEDEEFTQASDNRSAPHTDRSRGSRMTGMTGHAQSHMGDDNHSHRHPDDRSDYSRGDGYSRDGDSRDPSRGGHHGGGGGGYGGGRGGGRGGGGGSSGHSDYDSRPPDERSFLGDRDRSLSQQQGHTPRGSQDMTPRDAYPMAADHRHPSDNVRGGAPSPHGPPGGGGAGMARGGGGGGAPIHRGGPGGPPGGPPPYDDDDYRDPRDPRGGPRGSPPGDSDSEYMARRGDYDDGGGGGGGYGSGQSDNSYPPRGGPGGFGPGGGVSRYSDDGGYGGPRAGSRGGYSDSQYSEGGGPRGGGYYDDRRGGGGGGGGGGRRGYDDDRYGGGGGRRDRDFRGGRRGGGGGGGGGGPMEQRAAARGGPSAASKKPVDPNTFVPNDRHLFENARQRLIDFYGMVNPEKVKDVDKILEAYNGEEETLFRQLHLKYVDNLRKRLDPDQKAREEELLERARKLGTELPAPPPPEEVKLEGLTVDQLVEQGKRLMAEAPEAPLVSRGGGNQSPGGGAATIPLITNDSEVVPALEQLHVLTEANLGLAQEVAVAEQSVLQSRFRVILGKCLKSFNNAPNHLLVISDMHAGREFQVALSDAAWAYLKEAVLDTPLIHQNSVRVSVSASHIGGTTQVDRNILASALREWSHQSPHTVAERKNGRWSFSTSRTAWWTWPGTPAMRDAVPGRSLVYPTVHREPHKATNLNDASFPSLRDLMSARTHLSSSPNRAAAAAAAAASAGKSGGDASGALYDPNRMQPGYWDHFAHQMTVLQQCKELGEAEHVLKK